MTVLAMAMERRWAEQLTHWTVTVIAKALGADTSGLAVGNGNGTFTPLAIYGDGCRTEGTTLKLPVPLLQKLSQSPVSLVFPHTAFLPMIPTLSSVLMTGIGDSGKPSVILWVGRCRLLPFAETDKTTLLRFGQGVYHLLTPSLPFFINGTFMRSWLETSLRADAARRLEEGLAFLLELLLSVAETQDGGIVLMDREGSPRLGMACGDGQRLLEPESRPALLMNPHWLSKVVMEPDWMGLLAVRRGTPQRQGLVKALNIASGVLRMLVLWSSQSSWLDSLVWRDPLTGLLNRQAFQAKLEGELQRAYRYGYPVSVLVADLDGFKPINDLLGRDFGDRVLKRVAQTLRQSVRRYDLLCRLGGDEFALALPATSLEGALVVAERLRGRVADERWDEVVGAGSRACPELEAIRQPLGVSVGVTVTQGDVQEEAQKLLASADQAAMTAKAKGRNRVELAIAEGFVEAPTRLPAMPRDLWTALVQYLSHSLNNPTSGILGLAQLALQEKQLPPSVRDALEQIERLSLRLRDFSHRLAHMPVSELIQELEVFQRRLRAPSAGHSFS